MTDIDHKAAAMELARDTVKFSDTMFPDKAMDTGTTNLARAYLALQQTVDAIMEGQELLKAQTVRIRAVLGGSTRDNPDGLSGDTEELARLTMQRIADLEAKLGAALAEPTYAESRAAWERGVCLWTDGHGVAVYVIAARRSRLAATEEGE